MSVSSASETIATQLTNTSCLTECAYINTRIILNISFAIIAICLLISCFNSIFNPVDSIVYDPVTLNRMQMRPNRMCNCTGNRCRCNAIENFTNGIENFTNGIENFTNGIESFTNEVTFKTASNYQNIPLLSPTNENLLFGQAQRYIMSRNNEMIYRLEINCNLFILGGNVFGEKITEDANDKYIVVLKNTKDNKKLIIGDLVKDGDGIYKLTYISKENIKYLGQCDTVEVVYVIKDKSQTILSGTFKSQTLLSGNFKPF
jgi:hypothetical protein